MKSADKIAYYFFLAGLPSVLGLPKFKLLGSKTLGFLEKELAHPAVISVIKEKSGILLNRHELRVPKK